MSALVPGFKYDIFVSYAHVDNQPHPGTDEGWVSTLVEGLKVYLGEELGTRDFSLWIDNRLPGNEPLTSEILNALKQSATLLIVLSKGYLKSDWCTRERSVFLEAVNQHGGSEAVVFVVERVKVEKPAEIADILGYFFWLDGGEGNPVKKLGDPIPNPKNPADEPYYTRLKKLSYDLAKKLNQLKKMAEFDNNQHLDIAKESINELTADNIKTRNGLKADFGDELISLNSFRINQNRWLKKCFRSETESRAAFRQPLNVSDQSIRFIERRAAVARLDNWYGHWGENRTFFCVLGEEGDGKTWGVASWLDQKIASKEQFPAIIFLSSSNVDNSDPTALLTNAISRRFKTRPLEFWEKRLQKWLEQPKNDTPLFILVLDGVNERHKRAWWRGLLENLSKDLYRDRIAVLITCRTAPWQDYFDNLRYLNTLSYKLPPFNDEELNNALGYHDLKNSEIPEDLLPLIKKPRYFDLMLKYRDRLMDSGDFTVARLIYEDWRDRLQRKNNIDLDQFEFQDVIRKLAQKKKQGAKQINKREIANSLPYGNGMQATLNELCTGGILRGQGNRYKVDNNMLTLGFGLLLADQVQKAIERAEKPLEEEIAEWLEPHSGINIKAKICEFAALHALIAPDFPQNGRVALLRVWADNQNSGPEMEETFTAYFPDSPESYFALAETVWKNYDGSQWAQHLIMKTLRRWSESAEILPRMITKFEQWLGFFHPGGFSFQRGAEGEKTDEIKARIASRPGQRVKAGPIEHLGYPLTAVQDEGLLRLGRVALAIISHIPREDFIPAIIIGCLAEAVMEFPSKYDLVAWTIRSAPDAIWAKLRREIENLISKKSNAAQKAAYRLLSIESSADALQLRDTLPNDLFPSPPLKHPYKTDPCNSYNKWTREEASICIERDDLKPLFLAKKLKPLCIDPTFRIPSGLGKRIAQETDNRTIDALWIKSLNNSGDLTPNRIEPVLCAYSPEKLAKRMRQVITRMEKYQAPDLKWIAFKLAELSLIFNPKEQNIICHMWENMQMRQKLLDDTALHTEMCFFGLVLQGTKGVTQLTNLIRRPNDAIDLLSYETLFRPIEDWEEVQKILLDSTEHETVHRILWFISVNPEKMPRELTLIISKYLSNEISLIRGLAMKILFNLGDESFFNSFIESNWSWNNKNDEAENLWGSLILCKYGADLSYNQAQRRVHPAYLSYALEFRRQNQDEINKYAEYIHSILLDIGSEIPNLPGEFPASEVECDINNNICWNLRIGVERNIFSKSIEFASKDYLWGGITESDETSFSLSLSDDIENRLQLASRILKDIIEEQKKSGNIWFVSNFSINALEDVIRNQWNFVRIWLNDLFEGKLESMKRLNLVPRFYESLCEALLNCRPKHGLELYWFLYERTGRIRFQSKGTRIRMLDYALFRSSASVKMETAWRQRLRECKTDRELMEIVLVAQAGNGQKWLWKTINKDLKSHIAIEKARALTLMGFQDNEGSLKLLEKYTNPIPETWLEQLANLSLERWQKFSWSKHWFRRFLGASDDTTTWAGFRLFLRCVDRRFWHWYEQLRKDKNLSQLSYRRKAFFETNRGTIDNRIDQNEKSLNEMFLGQKILKNQVWPWMGVF